jgi:REP element-mobilizing transposase RayT
MELFDKQTTVLCTTSPGAFPMKFDSFESTFNLHYQIILRIANKSDRIEENWRLPFYKYLASCIKMCGGRVEIMRGAPDQVHLLIALRSTKALAEFLRELKLLSQTWVRRKMQIRQFAWQDSSEAFTVSATARPRVKAYIQRQNEHYRKRNKQKECGES